MLDGACSITRTGGAHRGSGVTSGTSISASFYASSTTANLELIATLQLVGADGAVTLVSSGTVLGSLASNDPHRCWFDAKGVPVRPYGEYAADQPVPPNSVQKYDFAVSPPGSCTSRQAPSCG
ncbi:hypothetical protein [Amycolatopsis sacchari]|uniref:hypothetical protein n=1 Tax=Amycolatopsis sacchari TaxID=115433 RepID=UPI003D70D5C6